ncbi:hypothetical protein ACSSS7_002729 [Eimeria intestinalis]
MEEGSKTKRGRDCDEQQKSRKKSRSQCQQQMPKAADADEAVCTPEGLKTKRNRKHACINESSKEDEQPEPEPSDDTVPANGTSKKKNGV